MRRGGVGVGMAFYTADACGGMAAMVKMHISRERGAALPSKGFCGVDGGIRVGGGVERQQARISTHDMAVALQTRFCMRQAGTGSGICPRMAALTLHVDFIGGRVGVMVKGYALCLLYRQRRIRMTIEPHRRTHPRCHKEAEGVQNDAPYEWHG